MPLKSFGSIVANAIEATVDIAHDAALRGDEFVAEEPGIWSVKSALVGDSDDPKPAVLITIYAG